MLTPEGSHLTTPYYEVRITPQILPAPAPVEPNYDTYDLFWLTTRMRPHLGKLRLIFRPVPDLTNAEIRRDPLIAQLTDQLGEYQTVEPLELQQLQQTFDRLLKDQPRYCLLLHGKAPAGMSQRWWDQQWRRHTPPEDYKPAWSSDGWLINLAAYDDYSERYDEVLLNTTAQLQQKWLSRWNQLSWSEPTTDTKWLYMPNERIIHELAKSGPLVAIGDYVNVPAATTLPKGTLAGAVELVSAAGGDVISYERIVEGKSKVVHSVSC